MVSSLRLQQFRSYKDASFEFEPGVNIIVGPNASGKTNLLEGLLVLSRSSGYRGHDRDLIQIDQDWARLDGRHSGQHRIIKIQNQEGKLTKTTTIDDKDFKRLPFAQQQPVVLFEPNHLRTLSGSPELRRNLLDNLLEQTEPTFAALARKYQRTLQQRNALLKQTNNQEQLFVWNIRLAELGSQIVEARLKLIETINKTVAPLYRAIANQRRAQAELAYQTPLKTSHYTSSLLHAIEKSTPEDAAKGFTSFGPHREDVIINLNGQNSAQTASRGEARTLLLVLKIIELDLIEQTRGKKPILLLDDVFSELDGARRQALTKKISNHQTFITTTDADVVVQHFMNDCHIIPLG